ncbi:hypothetical protein AWC30_16295 [Mycolicibacillus trivialis]|uniref:Uncharacterized protein n=1 Tax=Mycolicibacillus trivialis TaxID=1798 RepID=A0A1X2EES1_9MYCO|nr:hypothetical protein AWC30_16295 [Mycolicibacillus trivialis]
MLVAAVALGGGIAGSLLMSQARPDTDAAAPPPPAASGPSAAEIHTQDVRLCTTYITLHATAPKYAETGMDVLPAAAELRVALLENPDASPEIRAAMTDVLTSYEGVMAALAQVRQRGLAQPPVWDRDASDKAFHRAAEVCGRT